MKQPVDKASMLMPKRSKLRFEIKEIRRIVGKNMISTRMCSTSLCRNVRDYLDCVFHNIWIQQRRLIAWPARSTDLSSLDFVFVAISQK